MNRNAPLLSVCVPTYNSAEYLRQTISSILEQSFEDYELVIVDNNSTDKSEELISSIKDPRIKYHKNKENIGAVQNLNMCLSHATGTFIKLFCSDDVLLPGLLDKQVNVLITNENVSLVTCDMLVTDGNLNNPKRYNFYPGNEKGKLVVRKGLKKLINCIGGPSNVMFPKKFADNLKFDGKYRWVSDFKFFCEILLKDDSEYFNIGEPGIFYRRHALSDSETTCSEKIRSVDEYNLISEANYFTSKNSLKLLLKPIGARRKLKVMGKYFKNFIFRSNLSFSEKQ